MKLTLVNTPSAELKVRSLAEEKNATVDLPVDAHSTAVERVGKIREAVNITKILKKAKTVKPKKTVPKDAAPLQDPYSIIVHPLLTEKSIGMVERNNTLVFIVDRRAEKQQIKWAVQRAFEVKVDDVNTMIDHKGRKKATVKLSKESKAIDIATRFGML